MTLLLGTWVDYVVFYELTSVAYFFILEPLFVTATFNLVSILLFIICYLLWSKSSYYFRVELISIFVYFGQLLGFCTTQKSVLQTCPVRQILPATFSREKVPLWYGTVSQFCNWPLILTNWISFSQSTQLTINSTKVPSINRCINLDKLQFSFIVQLTRSKVKEDERNNMLGLLNLYKLRLLFFLL